MLSAAYLIPGCALLLAGALLDWVGRDNAWRAARRAAGIGGAALLALPFALPWVPADSHIPLLVLFGLPAWMGFAVGISVFVPRGPHRAADTVVAVLWCAAIASLLFLVLATALSDVLLGRWAEAWYPVPGAVANSPP